jgi:3-methyladenine DNA glycosylase AlkD
MRKEDIIPLLEYQADPKRIEGMKRYGINTENCLGISLYTLRVIAKDIEKNHKLALDLWENGLHEARLLAPMIDIAKEVDEEQMEQWVLDFNSWDICDQCCSNLFDKTIYAVKKALEWSKREEEFVKRAGFVLMASLSVHDKKMKDADFNPFFAAIIKKCTDERNYVKKAVNWALRSIGKRNLELNNMAIQYAQRLLTFNNKTAKWIARDALRELTSERVLNRLNKKK